MINHFVSQVGLELAVYLRMTLNFGSSFHLLHAGITACACTLALYGPRDWAQNCVQVRWTLYQFQTCVTLWFSWSLGSPCASGFSLRCSVVLVLSPHPTALTCSSTWASLGPLGYSVLGASEMPHRAVSVINHRLESMSESDRIKPEVSKCWPSFIWSANAIRIGLKSEGVS